MNCKLQVRTNLFSAARKIHIQAGGLENSLNHLVQDLGQRPSVRSKAPRTPNRKSKSILNSEISPGKFYSNLGAWPHQPLFGQIVFLGVGSCCALSWRNFSKQICMYLCMHVCINMYVCMYACMYVCIPLLVWLSSLMQHADSPWQVTGQDRDAGQASGRLRGLTRSKR